MAAVLLSGCETYRSPASLKGDKPIPVQEMTESIFSESAKLSANYDQLRSGLEQVTPFEVTAKPLPPKYDELENKIATINMYDTDIGKLLWVLADQMGLNLIVDPLVLEQKARASMYLRNMTVRELYSHIMEAFDLHAEVRNGALIISMLEERIFSAGILSPNVGINFSSGGDVFGSNSSSNSTGSGGADTLKADFSMSGNTERQTNPYQELENGIKQILGKSENRDRQQGTPRRNRPANQTEEEIESVPLIPTTYSLDKLTGTLYVKARPSQVRAIARLVERNKNMLTRQIQVEAQIIDISLDDGFRFGVDWNLLRSHVAGIYGADPMTLSQVSSTLPGGTLNGRIISIPEQLIGAGGSGSKGLGLSYGDDRFNATINALSSFGTLKVLSNPSVRVRNGTPALLSVGTHIRYISKSSSSVTNPGGGSSTTTSDVETDALFSGVVVGVIPYIHDNGRIELLIHPMQTEVEAASLALVAVGSAGNVVTLPRINYKGMTTTLNLGDGDVVLIGGLIDQQRNYGRDGIPGASEIPFFGKLFGDESSSHASRELVVVLRVNRL